MKVRKLIFLTCILLSLSGMDMHAAGTIITGSKTEKAYLHTDRDIYVAGENIFFKLYLVDAHSHKPSEISKIAYLIMHNSNHTPIAKIRLKVEAGIAYGSIFLPDTLSSGPYLLTVFTNWMRNAGEGTFFNKEIFIANQFDKDLPGLNTSFGPINTGNDDNAKDTTGNVTLVVTPGKAVYNKREKIKLSLKFPGYALNDSANLSISVFEEAPGRSNDLTISHYLLINSGTPREFPGRENGMFLPESKGEIFQGYVIDLDSRQPVAHSCVFLTAADSLVNLQYAYSDTTGMFRFLLNDYYTGKALFFSINNLQENRKINIEPEDKFDVKNDFHPIQIHQNRDLKDYILKSQDIVAIQKIYQAVVAGEIRKLYNRGSCPRLYYKPSYLIYPSDFVPLDDFAEISREILPFQLSLRKHDDRYSASMADENLHLFMDQEPVVFLDGVLIHDINQIMWLGSDKIKRVELVCSRYNCGTLVFPGILAVFSKDNEIDNIQPHSPSLQVKLQAYHGSSRFTAPDYSKESPGNLPDFRQLLYWNPSLGISPGSESQPEFYASDHSGNYMIRIEGITASGVPISASASFKVK